jgi:hypothetical protein
MLKSNGNRLNFRLAGGWLGGGRGISCTQGCAGAGAGSLMLGRDDASSASRALMNRPVHA